VTIVQIKRTLVAVATATLAALPSASFAAGAGGGGGLINFANMSTTAQGLASQGNVVGTVIAGAATVLGIAAVIAGRLNKSDLLSTAGAGVVGLTAIAAVITYTTGAAGGALL
jgi:hypothetical protein